jgi:hypothetical protein
MRCGPALIKREMNTCVGRIQSSTSARNIMVHYIVPLQLLLDEISDEIKLFLRCHICLFRRLLDIPLTRYFMSVFVCNIFPS